MGGKVMTTQTVSTSGSGLVFHNTYTANCSQQYINCIVAAEQQLERLWTNSVTINITFDEVAKGLRPKTSARVAKLSQHEADGGEFQEREGVAVEILPILGEAAATIEPRNRTFDDPALG
jgi:nitrogen fixation protein FixH